MESHTIVIILEQDLVRTCNVLVSNNYYQCNIFIDIFVQTFYLEITYVFFFIMRTLPLRFGH